MNVKQVPHHHALDIFSHYQLGSRHIIPARLRACLSRQKSAERHNYVKSVCR